MLDTATLKTLFTKEEIEEYDLESYKDKIPGRLLLGLVAWAEKKHRVGHFLTAVLSNDLCEAVARADEESMAALRQIVLFVYNNLPGMCWGSKEKVAAWAKEIASKAVVAST